MYFLLRVCLGMLFASPTYDDDGDDDGVDDDDNDDNDEYYSSFSRILFHTAGVMRELV